MSARSAFLPKWVQLHYDQFRRDIKTIVRDLRGQRTAPWRARSGIRYPPIQSLATRRAEVVEVVSETVDAVSLVLNCPDLPPVRSGQFFTLMVEIPGDPVPLRRAYSASGDCRVHDRIRLTIKRVAGGRASNWLVDHACVGMQIDLLGPSGDFGVGPIGKLVLIAGGSGITPMMAMLHSLPDQHPDAQFVVIYANNSEADTIFRDELVAIADRHRSRIALELVIGSLDEDTLDSILARHPLADDSQSEFRICGPAGMMTRARQLLTRRGVEPDRIQCEQFLQPHGELRVLDAQPVTLVWSDREVGVVVRAGQTLLEAGLAAGLAMPYSCTMGGCGACRVHVEHGKVAMQEPNCLTIGERDAGFVLACIGNPECPSRIRVN